MVDEGLSFCTVNYSNLDCVKRSQYTVYLDFPWYQLLSKINIPNWRQISDY